MNFFKFFIVFGGLFVFVSFIEGYRTYTDPEAFHIMLQERVSCFMVNTAAKVNRLNIENKIYDKNIIFSPVDLFVATAIAHFGVSDVFQRQQLDSILGLNRFKKFVELHPELILHYIPKPEFEEKMRTDLTKNNGEVIYEFSSEYFEIVRIFRESLELRKAMINSGVGLFVSDKHPLMKPFKQYMEEGYNSLYIMNYRKDAIISTAKINDIIEAQSFGKIMDFFNEPVPNTTQSVMTSSFTLIVNWKKMFQPNDSYETAFHTREGECDDCDDIDICMMMNQWEIPYYNDSKISAISLPTANRNVSLYYVVPQNDNTISEIINRPNKNYIKKIMDGLKPKRVVYHVPKMSFQGEVNQLDIIRSIGLNNVSLGAVANNLTLSIFKQKILLEINEEGIGGSPLMKSKKMPMMHESVDKKAIPFVADRPFLFFIYNNDTKIFLFYGAVFKPTGYTNF